MGDVTPDQVQAPFTGSDGRSALVCRGRPVAPVVFGVTDETLQVVKGAMEALAAQIGRTG